MSHNTHPALAGTEPVAQEGVPPGYTSISLAEALNGPSSVNSTREDTPVPANPGGNQPVAVSNAGEAANSTAEASRHGQKKSRGKRRGSNSSKPKPSGSVSSYMSANNSPLNEEAEPVGCPLPDPSEPPEAMPVVKVKSANTNVRVSLKIVNEVEQHCVGEQPLDIVEEELAKMAVAESLNDIPNDEVIPDIDELEEEHSTDDGAGDEGDDEEDEEDLHGDDPMVATLPNKPLNILESEPGTPISHISERSSQNSASSVGSTKQLLPSCPEDEQNKTTPLQHESKIVMVASKSTADDDIDDNEDYC